jgi:hypothetical protein
VGIYDRTSFLVTFAASAPRNVKKVPFVELFGGRLQGVASSGSDIERVYVSFIEAGTGNFYCSTNNNRPCGGLGTAPCKHISAVVEEAVVQYGAPTVAGYLRLEMDAPTALTVRDVHQKLHGRPTKADASRVFSRFLSYLRHCDRRAEPRWVPEMSWFG